MPYNKTTELPGQVRSHLPTHAQEIYLAAFNSAWIGYEKPAKRHDNESREETAHRIAWAAVKTHYQKNSHTGEWEEKIAHQMD